MRQGAAASLPAAVHTSPSRKRRTMSTASRILDLPLVLGQAGGEPTGSALAGILPLVALFAVFYLLVRPQQKRAKQQRALVAAVEVNDRVVTLGGMHGTVRYVDDEIIHLEVSPGTTVTFAKAAVARRLLEAEGGATE
jgi:preprotein translocase subunit YajC